MYNADGRKIVFDGAHLTFTVAWTGEQFACHIRFVAGKDRHGRHTKGVRILGAEGSTFPSGALLRGAQGETFRPGDDYVLPKQHNPCSFVSKDGASYDLFKVELVDQGEDGHAMHNTAGGVLYFHDPDAIPPELGGRGLLKEDPNRNLESA